MARPRLIDPAVEERRKRIRSIGVVLLVAVVLLAAAGVLGNEYLKLKRFKDERDVELLKKQLSRHLVLPKEEPLVATVTDVEKLKAEQAFYRNAKNGDKVFVWKDKALIYRGSEDRIVDFGIIVPSSATRDSAIEPSVPSPEASPEGAIDTVTVEETALPTRTVTATPLP
jgi:hypothetical protein